MTQKHIEQKVQGQVCFIPSSPELTAIKFGVSCSRTFLVHLHIVLKQLFGYTTV